MPEALARRRTVPPAVSMRRWVLFAIALTACAAGLVACGGSAKPMPQVQLQVDLPPDGTRVLSGSIAVSGSVLPAGASVLVLGKTVPVRRGAFSAQVPLAPGTNIVDVLAGAPKALAAMHVIRIFREIAVRVPNLSGRDPLDAAGRLKALGLAPLIHTDSGPFDFLIPVSPTVCSTKPAVGQTVPPGGQVTVVVSKSC